jgi:DNA topoisomerase VI subunit B
MSNQINIKKNILDNNYLDIFAEALSKKTNKDKDQIKKIFEAIIDKKLNEIGNKMQDKSSLDDHKNTSLEDLLEKDVNIIKDN